MEAHRFRIGALTTPRLKVSMTKVVCDTDFLMKVTNEPVPKLREFLESSDIELVTLPSVLRELTGLSSSSNQKTKKYARNALRTIEDKLVQVEKEETGRSVDADVALLDFALHRTVMIATLDGGLLSNLESRGISYLTLRNNRPFSREFGGATYLTTKKRQS